MKLTKTINGKKVWFCGCERIPSGTVGYERFDYYNPFNSVGHPKHDILFNRNKKRKEYICHEHNCYMVEPYTFKGEVK